jgi:hypothetical protein
VDGYICRGAVDLYKREGDPHSSHGDYRYRNYPYGSFTCYKRYKKGKRKIQPEEFAEYNAFVEQVKAEVNAEIERQREANKNK